MKTADAHNSPLTGRVEMEEKTQQEVGRLRQMAIQRGDQVSRLYIAGEIVSLRSSLSRAQERFMKIAELIASELDPERPFDCECEFCQIHRLATEDTINEKQENKL